MFEEPFKKEDFDTSSLMDVNEYATGAFAILLNMLNELQLKYSRTGNEVYKKQIEALLPGCYKKKNS